MQLPSYWKVVKLGEVAKIERGKFTHRPRNDPDFYGGDIPFIQTGDVTASNGRIKNYLQTLNEKGLSVSKIFPKGTIVITIAANIGYTGLLEFDSAFPDSLIGITPTNETIHIDNEYLNYYLWTQQPEMDRQAPRGTQKNINIQFLHPWLVVIPPLPEQRAIAHILRTIQKAKEARQRELELERERKATLMQYLFTYGTRNEPRKQTEIGEIPKSWQVVRLGKLCLNGLGIIQTGPFGSQLHASDYKSTGIPVVNPTNLGFNFIVEDSIPCISREKADSLSKHYLIEGDILISRRGDFSRYSYISKKYSGWFCGTGCLLIRLNTPEVNNYFLSILISTEFSQNYLKQNSVGSIMPNLNTQIIQDLPLKLPELTEQREIANILRACTRKIAALEREAATLDELFRAMLVELMTGRLPTQPLIEKEN